LMHGTQFIQPVSRWSELTTTAHRSALVREVRAKRPRLAMRAQEESGRRAEVARGSLRWRSDEQVQGKLTLIYVCRSLRRPE
jgi:hypothetical protein